MKPRTTLWRTMYVKKPTDRQTTGTINEMVVWNSELYLATQNVFSLFGMEAQTCHQGNTTFLLQQIQEI